MLNQYKADMIPLQYYMLYRYYFGSEHHYTVLAEVFKARYKV